VEQIFQKKYNVPGEQIKKKKKFHMKPI